jgi:hypothetical protein
MVFLYNSFLIKKSLMKTINISHITGDRRPKASLHYAVDELIKTSLTGINSNRNTVVNNISHSLYVTTNEEVILAVIRGMLQGMIANASDSVIDIYAKELYGQMIEVKIKDENCYNTYAVAVSLQEAVPLAEKIGGHLDIANQKQKITTVTFRFPFEKNE